MQSPVFVRDYSLTNFRLADDKHTSHAAYSAFTVNRIPAEVAEFSSIRLECGNHEPRSEPLTCRDNPAFHCSRSDAQPI
jgi:hypothetical protein